MIGFSHWSHWLYDGSNGFLIGSMDGMIHWWALWPVMDVKDLLKKAVSVNISVTWYVSAAAPLPANREHMPHRTYHPSLGHFFSLRCGARPQARRRKVNEAGRPTNMQVQTTFVIYLTAIVPSTLLPKIRASLIRLCAFRMLTQHCYFPQWPPLVPSISEWSLLFTVNFDCLSVFLCNLICQIFI